MYRRRWFDPSAYWVSLHSKEMDLRQLWVEILLEGDAKLFAEGLEFVKVLLVLLGVLDLGLDTCVLRGGVNLPCELKRVM